jgi:hypothetical protein
LFWSGFLQKKAAVWSGFLPPKKRTFFPVGFLPKKSTAWAGLLPKKTQFWSGFSYTKKSRDLFWSGFLPKKSRDSLWSGFPSKKNLDTSALLRNQQLRSLKVVIHNRSLPQHLACLREAQSPEPARSPEAKDIIYHGGRECR